MASVLQILRRALNVTRRVGVRVAFPRRDATLRLLGSDYGGWFIPEIDPTWVCCTAGVGEDATLDVALAGRGCQVVAVDPTPRAIAHMEPLLRSHATLRLAPYAIWVEETELEFFPPANPSHVSYSATNLHGTDNPIAVPAKPLEAILREFGHAQVQLVKLDIEGAEYRVLQALDLDALGVKVLCVEFHFDAEHGLSAMINAIRRVERAGFRAAYVRRTDVTFLRL